MDTKNEQFDQFMYINFYTMVSKWTKLLYYAINDQNDSNNHELYECNSGATTMTESICEC